jgi:hypothetical protein
MNRIMKSFLWTGTDVVHGGKCIVEWSRLQLPLVLAGLGITDIKLWGRVLQTYWLWLEDTQPTLPWVAIQGKTDATVVAFFRASTRWSLGDRETINRDGNLSMGTRYPPGTRPDGYGYGDDFLPVGGTRTRSEPRWVHD